MLSIYVFPEFMLSIYVFTAFMLSIYVFLNLCYQFMFSMNLCYQFVFTEFMLSICFHWIYAINLCFPWIYAINIQSLLKGPGRFGDRIPVRERFFHTCPDRPWGPPSLLYNGYHVFPGGKEWPGHNADPSPLPVPWPWKSRAIPVLPLWAIQPVQSLSACTRVHFTYLLKGRKISVKISLHLLVLTFAFSAIVRSSFWVSPAETLSILRAFLFAKLLANKCYD
jgi:hypothetical protein